MIHTENHFNEAAWCDMARGLIAADAAIRMRSHLDQGCQKCNESYNAWALVVQTAAPAVEHQPPEDALRSVQSAFSLTRKLPALPRIARLAQLVFDSFRQPLPVGVRGGAPPTRQLLHESGDLVIDLQLEPGKESRVFLAGQAIHKTDPEITAGAGVVVVDQQQQLVTQTIANAVGEFQAEFEGRPGLTMYLETANATVVGIPLPDPQGPREVEAR
jgi:hypothetical protein